MPGELLSLLCVSLLLTEALELLFALCAGVRTARGLLLVALANLMTNPPAALGYLLTAAAAPALCPPAFALVEAAAVLAEGWCYRGERLAVRRPFLFSLGANVFSVCAGALLRARL